MTWHPVDIVVLILTIALSAAVLFTTVAPVILKTPISDERSKTLSQVALAAFAIIAVYVGAQIKPAG